MALRKSPLPFESKETYNNIPSSTAGIKRLSQFQELNAKLLTNEALKSHGLTDDEIQIYNDYKKGPSYMENAHTKVEKTVLYQMLDDIKKKIDDDLRQNEEIKKNIKPKIATHPINQLEELQEDIFGHFDVDKLPTPNRQRKIIRRMNRKLELPPSLPETSKIEETTEKLKNEQSHSYNNFIKRNDTKTNKTNTQQYMGNKPNSKWDAKEMTLIQKELPNSNQTERLKRIGCSESTLYTIKDNKILRLEKKTKGDPNNLFNTFEAVNITIPINKAEEELMEGKKLSLDDIKMIPKFQNYNPGIPSKVLFLKNLSNSIKEDDLKTIFKNFIDIRLMTGKMKGQAFITFESIDIATKSLQEANGIILKGKPIILQYGKKH